MPATIPCSCGTTLAEHARCPPCGGIKAHAPAPSSRTAESAPLDEPLPDVNVRSLRWVAWELAMAVFAFLVLAGIIYVYSRD